MKGQGSTVVRAICPHCERNMRVKVDGTLGHHNDPNASRGGSPWGVRCPGAGWHVMDREDVRREMGR